MADQKIESEVEQKTEEENDEEQEKLKILQEKCPKATPGECQRFLTARKGKVDGAVAQLSAFLTWVETHELESRDVKSEDLDADEKIWQHASKIALLHAKKEVIKLPQLTRVHIHHETREEVRADGTRIVYVIPAKMNKKLADGHTYGLNLALYLHFLLERNSMEKLTILLDVRGGDGWPNPSAYGLMPFIRSTVTHLNNLFPERLGRCVLYPVPTLSLYLWEMAKVFIDKDTVKKIVLFNSYPKLENSPPNKQIAEYVDDSVVRLLEQARIASFIVD